MVDSINALGRGTSELLGEGWTEYISDIIGMCMNHCNRGDPKVVRALATTLYAHDSPLARELARENGPQVTAIVLDRAETGSPMARRAAVLMLGTLFVEGRGLTADQKTRIHAVAQAGVKDKDVIYRLGSIAVLGQVGSQADIATLREVSRRDLVTTSGRAGLTYPVRNAADSAIAQIQRRTPR